MRTRARTAVAAAIALWGALPPAAPAWAQTGGLESPSLWVLIASLVQIVGAAAVMVFFITRRRSRGCPRCGRRLARGDAECPRCGSGSADVRRPPREGS